MKNIKNVKLTIIGDGELRLMLRDMIDEYGLEDRVELLGEVDSISVYEYLKGSIFYFPLSTRQCLLLSSRQ